MDLDRGVPAKIARKLLAGLGQTERDVPNGPRPGDASKWSTWKRYCDSAGMSMGRALAAMIDQALVAVLGESADGPLPVFAEQAEEELARRQEQVARQERDATAVEERLRASNEHLRRWEGELGAREQRAEFTARVSARRGEAPNRIGRNERCSCGSGIKYKH